MSSSNKSVSTNDTIEQLPRQSAYFKQLEDSPMFKQEARDLEAGLESLKERIAKLLKGTKRYRDSIESSSEAQQSFCRTLREFCGEVTDQHSLDIGAGVLIRYISAFNEISSFCDLLKSQVNLLMVERLNELLVSPMNNVKEVRKRMEKSCAEYDQCRKKFLSLQRDVREEICIKAEKDLHNARKAYDSDRFALAQALVAIHHAKRSFFVESTSELMDAHMRFFKQGYDLIRLMEPYIHESLNKVEEWRGDSAIDMNAFDRDISNYIGSMTLGQAIDKEVNDNLLDSSKDGEGTIQKSMYNTNASPGSQHQRSRSQGNFQIYGLQGGPIQMTSGQSQIAHEIESKMKAQRIAGTVSILRQGYLLKRSSNMRGDWKRRFFVLDSRGVLYYYTRSSYVKPGATNSDPGVGKQHQTVELLTSTLKMDLDGDDMLRFCFRIVSPMRTYTLQAENEADRSGWVDSIQGVISSLLNSVSVNDSQISHHRSQSSGSEFTSNIDHQFSDAEESVDCLSDTFRSDEPFRSMQSLDEDAAGISPILEELGSIPGNDFCADCNAPSPDWASLNLCCALCIECSGIHRQLGVHISKVRSMTLDVKVWEENILTIFRATGNKFMNSIMERRLADIVAKNDSWVWNADDDDVDVDSMPSPRTSTFKITRKPTPQDSLKIKEEYIIAKYVHKMFQAENFSDLLDSDKSTATPQELFWRSVFEADYKSIVLALMSGADVNHVYNQNEKFAAQIAQARERQAHSAAQAIAGSSVVCKLEIEQSSDIPIGITALHIMSELKELTVLEVLLLQNANINAIDMYKRTPLHYCILNQWDEGAKLLIKKGGVSTIRKAVDVYGLTALEMAMGRGQLTDEDLFTSLAQS